jgi:hypothetical protein
MTGRGSKQGAPKSSSEALKAAQLQRREQALRENLKRRKEQDRARKQAAKPPG